MRGILSVPCFPAGTPHNLLPVGTDRDGRRIEECTHCGALFRMPPDHGGPRGPRPLLAVDLMATNLPPVPAMLQTNPARSLGRV